MDSLNNSAPSGASTPAITRLCLVRHGETFWNAERRLQGHQDIGLNAAGLLQARAAARRLSGEPVAALYASDLSRARLTAEAIAAHLGLPPRLLRDFRERCYGIFEGLTYDEARERHPAEYAAFESRDPDFAFPGGGESLVGFSARVTRQLAAVAAAHPGQTVVIVTHGGVLDVVNRFVRGNPLHTPRDFHIPNAGLNWLEVDGAAAQGAWRIALWGCTRHLDGDALDELPGA